MSDKKRPHSKAFPTDSAATGPKVASPDELFQELARNLEEESRKSAFALGGIVQIVDPDTNHHSPGAGQTASNIGSVHSETELSTSSQVILRWDGKDETEELVARLEFPINNQDQQSRLRKLVDDCEPATFGRGNKDVLDENYRRAGKLDETSFSTNFNPYSLGIIDIISKILVPSISGDKVARSVRAELYKLNVYSGPSGRFKPHVDTPRSSAQFGSLVVCLPCSHEGGQLVVRHAGNEVVFDWSTAEAASGIAWAAFFSDCEHEVLEVTKGHRVTLTYNLYVVSTTIPRSMSALDPKSLPLYSTLLRLLNEPNFMRSGGFVGLYCAHAYAHTSAAMLNKLPWNLKGIDMTAYQCLTAAGLTVELRPVADTSSDHYMYVDQLYELFDIDWQSEIWGDLDSWLYDSENKTIRGKPTQAQIDRRDRAILKARKYKLDEEGVLLGDTFREMNTTDCGGSGEEGLLEIFEAGLHNIEYRYVEWLNRRQHPEPSFVYLAYGNEAQVETVYSSAALIVKIPPFAKRQQL